MPADAFGAAPSPPAPETAKTDQPQADTAAPEIAGATRRGGKLPIVMIDAGHGGKDVGATPAEGDGIPAGRYEKDITLAIARATAATLERGRGRSRRC